MAVLACCRVFKSPLFFFSQCSTTSFLQLRLEGIDVNEEETISEPGLLAEIMEVREAVEEAPDSKTLNEIQSQMQEKFQEWSNSFANAFQTKKFDLALTCIRRMKYYDRVIEEIGKRL
ncbi:hypothetical protein K2173_003889 [Erythroxylum novogranatense]|uniref:Co-chaperone HscB C-terminal oligomerisation domain-containing protein n=1 Tax=Erythroxylum novogranatense TaxID=1862640 RepID=A0AAV8SJW5_9ROSI|nr:hypothetical protein K2173_003889 [Erythroxylum novogranatense]